MPRRKSYKKNTKRSIKGFLKKLSLKHVLAFLGLAVFIVFLGLQLNQTRQVLAWGDSCSSNSQCSWNQKCAKDWAGRQVCQTLDCRNELSGGGYCSGTKFCAYDIFGSYISNHKCVPKCGVYKTYWGYYACGYKAPTPTPIPSCASKGGTCARSCTGGKHEISGKCDRYNRLSCCK